MVHIRTDWLNLIFCRSLNKEQDEQNIKIILGGVMSIGMERDILNPKRHVWGVVMQSEMA